MSTCDHLYSDTISECVTKGINNPCHPCVIGQLAKRLFCILTRVAQLKPQVSRHRQRRDNTATNDTHSVSSRALRLGKEPSPWPRSPQGAYVNRTTGGSARPPLADAIASWERLSLVLQGPEVLTSSLLASRLRSVCCLSERKTRPHHASVQDTSYINRLQHFFLTVK